jgi:hypothetical protein
MLVYCFKIEIKIKTVPGNLKESMDLRISIRAVKVYGNEKFEPSKVGVVFWLQA